MEQARLLPADGNNSLMLIYRALQNQLPREYTHKKCKTSNESRFSPENLRYTQAFMDELFTRNPHRLKFFDEAGFAVSSTHPNYGWSPIGMRAIEIRRYHDTPNVSLNLMIGTSGVVYANTLQGATTGVELLNFFGQAMRNRQKNGEPCLKAGDTVIMDNCTTHHGQFEQPLKQFLNTRGVELIFTPKYSPELNAVEHCFDKLRTLSKQKKFRDMFDINVEYGIYQILKEVTPLDCHGFLSCIGYLNL